MAFHQGRPGTTPLSEHQTKITGRHDTVKNHMRQNNYKKESQI